MAILVKSDSARNFEDLPPTQRCIDSVYIRRGCDRKRFNSAAFIKKRGIQSPGRAGGASLQRLWDLIVTGLHGNTNQSKQVEKDLFTSPTRNLGKIDDLNSVDFVSSNANSCHKEAIVHFWEVIHLFR